MTINVSALIILFFAGTTVALSQSLEDQAAALSEAAIGNSLPPLSFVDTQGRKVELAHFRGKPVLVSLVYTGCADVCPAIIQNLYPAIEVAQEALGEDAFNELHLNDRDGHTIMMLEARTFYGADEDDNNSVCGNWFELTLPVRDAMRSARFWAPIAPVILSMREEPTMHMRFDAGGIASMKLAELDYRHIRRPIWPLDGEAVCS